MNARLFRKFTSYRITCCCVLLARVLQLSLYKMHCNTHRECSCVLWMFGAWNNRNLHVVTHVQMLQMISKNGWNTRLESLVRTGMVWNAHMPFGPAQRASDASVRLFFLSFSWVDYAAFTLMQIRFSFSSSFSVVGRCRSAAALLNNFVWHNAASSTMATTHILLNRKL